jgi:hypothetical protein
MKLLTKKIIKDAQAQYDKNDEPLENQMVVGKFFTPWTNWTWYLMNMHEDENYCWGIVQGNALEMGSFLISALKEVDGPFGLKIERDKFFKPINAHDMWEKLNNE